MPDVQQYLRGEEWNLYGIHSTDKRDPDNPGMNDILERLVEERERSEACRALLEKHEWDGYREYWKRETDIDGITHEHFHAEPACPSCEKTKKEGHAPDCAIAAQLAGTRGE